jgi:hypothetical protein
LEALPIMAELSTVVIHVADGQGVPVAEALVSVEKGTAAFPEIAYLTGPDGNVTLKLPMGRFEIGATDRDNRKRGRTPITTGAGGSSALTITIVDR